MPTKIKDNIDIQPIDYRYDEGIRGRTDTNVSTTITTKSSGYSGTSMIMSVDSLSLSRCDNIEKDKNMKSNLRIRKLIPLECMKLMGFSKKQYADISNFNDGAIYHVAGDSICVPVLMALFGELTDINYRQVINDYIEKEVVGNEH